MKRIVFILLIGIFFVGSIFAQERQERPERPNRPERADRAERTERTERSGGSERNARLQEEQRRPRQNNSVTAEDRVRADRRAMHNQAPSYRNRNYYQHKHNFKGHTPNRYNYGRNCCNCNCNRSSSRRR